MGSRVVIGGALVYFTAAGCAYWYLRPGQAARGPRKQDCHTSSGSAFDRLASIYDDTVGREESYMGYGLMRWWLVRKAQGNVLEISAGTGRNLPHYNLSHINSLTLTDLSPKMLEVAEHKYYDVLQLGYKHPDCQPKFLLTDAQSMVAATPQAAREVPLQQQQQQQQQQTMQPALPPAARSTESAAKEMGVVHQTGSPTITGSSRSSSGMASAHSCSCAGSTAAEVASTSPFESIWRQKSPIGSSRSPSRGVEGVAVHSSRSPSTSSKGYISVHTAGADAGGGISPGSTTVPSSPSSSSSSNSSSNSACGSGAVIASSEGNGDNVIIGSSSSKSWWLGSRARSHNYIRGPGSEEAGTCSSSSSSRGTEPLSSFPAGSYDVVVDTFGLCSHEDPVKVLQQAALLLKPGGRLLLLEHGKSSWGWLEEHMDKSAEAHHDKYGCWWNRDILGILKEAGLNIVSFSRWHFGTSYLIVAEPVSYKG